GPTIIERMNRALVDVERELTDSQILSDTISQLSRRELEAENTLRRRCTKQVHRRLTQHHTARNDTRCPHTILEPRDEVAVRVARVPRCTCRLITSGVESIRRSIRGTRLRILLDDLLVRPRL